MRFLRLQGKIFLYILFGSYARGTATDDSDIDLAVILDTEDFAKSLDERLDRKRPINKSIRKIEETGKELYGK